MGILRWSIVGCEEQPIPTAETVDLIFYQYSILLPVPLALLAGAFTVVAPAPFSCRDILNASNPPPPFHLSVIVFLS